MVIGITGHRPNKLGGYEFFNPLRVKLRVRLEELLLQYRPSFALSGMALGTDQDFAYSCYRLGIPFVAVIPFEGQESRWPSETQSFYRNLLTHATQSIIVSPGGYAAWKMQTRNEWVVDHCDLLLGVWDGTSGGTKNCLEYAWKVGRTTEIVDPRQLA